MGRIGVFTSNSPQMLQSSGAVVVQRGKYTLNTDSWSVLSGIEQTMVQKKKMATAGGVTTKELKKKVESKTLVSSHMPKVLIHRLSPSY